MKTSIIIQSTVIGVALFIVGALLSLQPEQSEGAAFPGQSTYLQTATSTTVYTESREVEIFPANASCKARVITTRDSHIFMNFGDEPFATEPLNLSSTTLNNTKGHYQAASTTVAYDAGIYGCGRWHAVGVSTTTIITSEF
jgi:hypothetical protein